MPVTKGHGNPPWTREEVILALELYHELGGKIPDETDRRIVQLSEELRGVPYHAAAAKKETFRNPAGVAFKLQNLASVRTGGGLSNTAEVDREVWRALGANPDATRQAAAAIRSSLLLAADEPEAEDDVEFLEGRAVTQAHRRLERSRGLRKRVLANRRNRGIIACDVCGTDGRRLPLGLQESIFEAHHKMPLSMTGQVKTRVADMALLCASCHRFVHKLMADRMRWVGVEEAKGMLKHADS